MAVLVTVTPAALVQLRAALEAADEPDLALRAAARRTDDGEIEYGMGLDEPREQDEEIEIDTGVKVLVSVASRDLIAGTAIDYVEIAPGEFRFLFYRPGPPASAGAETTGCAGCGCGAADAGGGNAPAPDARAGDNR